MSLTPLGESKHLVAPMAGFPNSSFRFYLDLKQLQHTRTRVKKPVKRHVASQSGLDLEDFDVCSAVHSRVYPPLVLRFTAVERECGTTRDIDHLDPSCASEPVTSTRAELVK